ncbi:MAG TPA: hypothetical protein VIA06_06665 [Candidatus Dormibacteraeota bacterium]|jgi:hypothetical protein|nr:hypothetical protein [Candidatus Dormibacteraeota bacterium]
MEFRLGLSGLPTPEELAVSPGDAVEDWAREYAGQAQSGDELTPAIEVMDQANELFARIHGLPAPEEGLGR